MRHLLFFFAFLFTVYLWSQTSNKGMLYISKDTKFSTLETLNNLPTGEWYNDGETFVYSHFNNDGRLDFYQQTGRTHFVGSTDQIISGSEPSYFQDLHLNNHSTATPFLLTGKLEINGIAAFHRGILNNRDYGGSILFRENARHTQTSDGSFVDGEVGKIGTVSFPFPIGHKEYYRVGSIATTSRDVIRFSGIYFLENSHPLYSHDQKEENILQINNAEYWIFQPSVGHDETLISLSWHPSTTPTSIIEAAESNQIHIVRWDQGLKKWIDQGGVANLETQSVTTAIKDFGVFTLAIPIIETEDILVYNMLTPDGDGANDYFHIEIPADGSVRDMRVKIFNRWGVQVYASNNYGVDGDVFDGYSTGRMTFEDSKKLPTGTYFYTLDYEYGLPNQKNRRQQAGYLYISIIE